MADKRTQKRWRKRWIAALRSGQYNQGKNYLKQTVNGCDKFCCLGVLCDLAIKAKKPLLSAQSGNVCLFGDAGGNVPSIYTLPKSLRELVGLSGNLGEYKSKGKDTSLAKQNDSGKYDFNQIADIIEQEPKGLFL